MFNISQIPCAGEAVQFDDVSAAYAGFITKWNWDFGDGNTQTVLHPANPDTDHTYANSGTYTVKLTITSSDSCTAERFETIVINPAPIANFDFENPCQGTPVQFNDLNPNRWYRQYEWMEVEFRRWRFGCIQYFNPAESFAYLCCKRKLPGVTHRFNCQRMYF